MVTSVNTNSSNKQYKYQQESINIFTNLWKTMNVLSDIYTEINTNQYSDNTDQYKYEPHSTQILSQTNTRIN